MTPQEVLVHVSDHEGGTFFVEDGKITALDLTYGFAVGMAVGDAAVLPSTCGRHALWNAILGIADEWMTRHVGVWVDGDRIVVDPVVVYKHQTQALGAAERYHQRAIYDFANSLAIEVNA